jgi:hypothetical protein
VTCVLLAGVATTEQRAHLVDAHLEYLHRRWNEGERNATGLFREITKLGYQGGELASELPAAVPRWARTCRAARPETTDGPRGPPAGS